MKTTKLCFSLNLSCIHILEQSLFLLEMDLITAVSFASNVISFVQFVSDLFKSTREMYGSANVI